MTKHKLSPMPFVKEERALKLGPPPKSKPELLDLLELCQKRAKLEGYDLEASLWGVVKQMLAQALDGDTQAAKLVLDRFFGPVQKAPQLEMNVELTQSVGPPIPEPDKLKSNLVQLIRLAHEGEDFDIVDAEVVEPDDEESGTLEDLL